MNNFQSACLLSCVRTQNFSVTADEMGISHQAVSKIIQKIEDESGLTLFIRRGQNIFITEAGKKFCFWVQEMDNQLRWASDYFSELRDRGRSVIKIAFSSWLALSDLTDKLTASINFGHPDLDVYHLTGSENLVYEMLMNRKADLAIIHGDTPARRLGTPGVFAAHLSDKKLKILYGSQNTKRGGTPDWQKILSYGLVCSEEMKLLEPQFGKIYSNLCERYGGRPRPTNYVKNFRSVLAGIQIGNGFTIAPCDDGIDHFAKSMLETFDIDDLPNSTVPIVCLWRNRKFVGSLRNAFGTVERIFANA